MAQTCISGMDNRRAEEGVAWIFLLSLNEYNMDFLSMEKMSIYRVYDFTNFPPKPLIETTEQHDPSSTKPTRLNWYTHSNCTQMNYLQYRQSASSTLIE
jgi:hypothetical protein